MSEFIDQVHEVLEQHYHDDQLTASKLHQRLQMSRSTLHNKLKEERGVSTAAFLTSFRLDKAKQLLLSGDQSVKEIAFMIGFRDPNYFSRVFRKWEGVSPIEYRRKTTGKTIVKNSKTIVRSD